MKKYIFGTLLLSTALLSGCSLDETPKSAFSEQEAFKSSTLIYACLLYTSDAADE